MGRPREFGPWAVLGPLGEKFPTRQRLYQKAPPKYRAGGDAIAFPAPAGLAHPRVAQSRPLCGRPSGRVPVWRRHQIHKQKQARLRKCEVGVLRARIQRVGTETLFHEGIPSPRVCAELEC